MTNHLAVAPWSLGLPDASPPQGMSLYRLPTGFYETRAAFAVKGGAFRDKRRFAASSVLITHPAGDLLIDAGFGADLSDHVALLPRVERARYSREKTVKEQLDAAGYDWANLRGVLVTHVHWDHVSGLDSLHVPIWINADEMRYGAEDTHGAVFRTVSAGLPVHQYAFDGPAYLGFPASHDVYGDGSVVIAEAGGHTFGSVVVFVTVPDGDRYAFIGDIAWQFDAITDGLERPWLMRKMADTDAAKVRENLQRVIALRDLMRIVPAHDGGAYESIAALPARFPTVDGSQR